MGDLAVCGLAAVLAVAESEGDPVVHDDGGNVASRLDAVTVQAEHRAVNRLPTTAQRHICVQIVFALGFGQFLIVRPRGKGDGLAGMPVPVALVPAAEVVLMRLYQQQTVFVFVDRDRIPAQIARELLRVLIVQARAGGDSHTSRRGLRGHADFGACVQTVNTDDDGLIRTDQIHIVVGAALLVAGNGHLAGHGKFAAEIRN